MCGGAGKERFHLVAFLLKSNKIFEGKNMSEVYIRVISTNLTR